MKTKLEETLETINKIDHFFHAEIKAVNDEERTIEGWASTEDIDRINDVVLAKAFKGTLKEFMRNPVLTFMHDLRMPVGSIKEAKVVPGKGLWVKAFIDTTEERIWQKVKQGTIKAFSFGFKILNFHEEKIKGVLLRIIDELDLLEVALVSVPMNRNALFSIIKAFEPGRSVDLVCDGGCKECGKCLENYKATIIEGLELTPIELKTVAEIVEFIKSKGLELVEDKAIVPFKKYPLAPEGMRWSFTSAEGSAILGDPPDWNKFKAVHTWFDPENDETRAGFKLPHHKEVGGQVKTVWRGVVASWARRTTADIPASEMPGIESHLRKHAKEFDRELGGKDFWLEEIKQATETDKDLDYLNEVIKVGIEAETETDEAKEDEALLAKYKEFLVGIEHENKIWEETENEIRNRLKAPDLFKEGSFRRITLKKDKPRVFAIIGRLKGETTTSLQALRFPKEDTWTLAKAKAWVKDHPDVVKQFDEVDAKNFHIINFIQPEEIITDYSHEVTGEGECWKYTITEGENPTVGSKVRQFTVTHVGDNNCTFSEREGVFSDAEKIGQSLSSKNRKSIQAVIDTMKQNAGILEAFLKANSASKPDGDKDKDKGKSKEVEPTGAEPDNNKKDTEGKEGDIQTVDISSLLNLQPEVKVVELSEDIQAMLTDVK